MSTSTTTTTTTRPGDPPTPDFAAAVATAISGQMATTAGDTSVWGVPDQVRNATIITSGAPSAILAGGAGPSGRLTTGSGPTPGWATATGQQILSGFQNLSGDQLTQLQLQLVLNGFDTRTIKDIKFGQHDPGSYTAFAHAVTAAYRYGRPLDDLLNDVPLTSENVTSALAGHNVNVVQHRSQADMEEAALRGFQAATGHAPTTQQRDAFIAAYRQKETASQPSTAGGGTFNVTDPGDPTVAAKAAAQTADPQGSQNYERLQQFNVMLQALGVPHA